MKPIEPGCLVLILKSTLNCGKSATVVRKVEGKEVFTYRGVKSRNKLEQAVWLVESDKLELRNGIKGLALYKNKNLMRLDDLDENTITEQGEKNDFIF